MNTFITGNHFLFLLIIIFGVGCNNGSKNIPFPQDEMEYAQPVSRSYKLGDSIPIKWTETPMDSIKPSNIKKFSYAALTAKPFDIGGFTPLTSPLEEESFNWNSLPDTVFDYKNLPTQKLAFKTVLIERPKIIKAIPPTTKAGASRGVIEPNLTQGFSGIGRCFLQDSLGFIWVGTDKGLCRYDGTNIELYGAAQGLTDQNIWAIAEDSSKNIWMGTGSGEVYVLDRKAGLVHQLIDSFVHGSVYGILKDKGNQMWIVRNRNGVIIVNTAKETVKQFSIKEGLADNFNLKIIQDKKDRIWLSTGRGATIVDEAAHQIKKLDKFNGVALESIFSLHEDAEENIWVGGNSGALKVNIQKGTISKLSKKQGLVYTRFITGFLEDRNGLMWIATDSGVVFRLNQKAKTIERILVAPGPGNMIYNIFQDKQGQVWMGTINANCFTINDQFGRPANLTKANGLADNRVWGVLEAKDGKMWIATYNGIDVYDPAFKIIKNIGTANGLHNPGLIKLIEGKDGKIWAAGNGTGVSIIDINNGTIEYIGKEQGLETNGVNVLFEDTNGEIWLGTGDGKIMIYNPFTKRSKTVENIQDWKGIGINTMLVDHLGQLWISSYGKGVLVFNKARNAMRHLTSTQGLISNASLSLLEDEAKNIWIATERGVDVLNQSKKTVFSFTTREGLVNDAVWTLNKFNHQYYLGTSAGLSIVKNYSNDSLGKSKWRVSNYGKAQGLTYLDFAENGSWITKSGQFWAGIDNQTLIIMDEPKPDTFVCQPFITSINIIDKPQVFNDRNYTINSIKNIDTLWKPSNESLFYSDKKLPSDSGYLTQHNIGWDSVDNAFKMPKELRLPFDQNFLSFSFTTTQYVNTDQVRFRYILEGIDKNWSKIIENKQSENYRDLPSGNYTFKVASKGMNGIWSTPAAFNFTILPPWWKSWWAYLIYLAIFAGALRAYIIFRSRTLRRQNQILEDKVASRTNALQKSLNDLQETQKQLIQSEKMASLGELTAGIAHEIQNPLNFVNNFSEVNIELLAEMNDELTKGNIEEARSIAKDVTDNEEKIIFHGKRADSIVKGMLQHSRASSSVKELTDINVLADEYLRLSYHGLRARDKSFNATINTNFDPTVEKINIVPQDVGRVILNLLTNAFYAVREKSSILNLQSENKSSFQPTVSITTKKMGDKVEIRVTDNGGGIPQKVVEKIFQPFFTTKPTGQGTGLGLSLSYDIISKGHGGTLTVETKEGEGSTFIIQLPL